MENVPECSPSLGGPAGEDTLPPLNPDLEALVVETLDLFPIGSCADAEGHLWLGGCRVADLAHQYGTPLYVFDENTVREQCQSVRQMWARNYEGTTEVAYASKAYLNLALAELFAQEGLSLDVVSAGELYLAKTAGFPPERIHFHGNNKSSAELEMALDLGVARIVVDNLHELDLLEGMAAGRGIVVPIWLRLSPGVDAHTHAYQKTGQTDSKFGFPIDDPDFGRTLARIAAGRRLDLTGLHAHIGSQIWEAEPYAEAVTRLLDLAARHGLTVRELSPGGGWAVPYTMDDPDHGLLDQVRSVCHAVTGRCRVHGMPLPTLVVEPGRALIARAGVALYRVGSRKEIPGGRTYVSVDGGMGDNIRPALYAAQYAALAATKAGQPAEDVVTIAGRFCESGDLLLHDVALPHLVPGDLLAVPAAGAYCLPLASNYNLVPRPAVVLVNQGTATLIQRRETLSDLVARDYPLPR